MFTKEQVDEMIAKAVKEATESLAAKNAELLDEKKKVAAEKRDLAEKVSEFETAAEAAERKRLESKGEWDKLRAKLEDGHKKEIEGLKAALDTEKSATRKLVAEDGLRKSIIDSGVAPHFADAVFSMLKDSVSVFEDGDVRKAVAKTDSGEIDVAEFVKGFVGSDKGKHFVAAPLNGGGGAATKGSTALSGKNPFKKDSFNLTEQTKLLRENPEMASRLKAEAGL
ncbi:hypothetical protein [Azospirillum brasilense]|uniref:hypothetical protein n=1 Tax=Azospirillum brasilense TaxID=192 RepID=UPI000E694057|nr:hypothetical protein [Azospirillum brasilense]NUB24717.1 hypothetical protein [Azospirillum brasilense]NUB30679.1 hypothetical protein [Azospirillum brasilense]RIW08289.1 hypothetical protein D2T81_00830 [Azospirillum brasilense]